MDSKNRVPWIVASLAIVFAVMVLIRAEMAPAPPSSPEPSPVPTTGQAPPATVTLTPAVRPSPAPTAPPATPELAELPLPAPLASPTAAPTPTPTPAVYSLPGMVLDVDNKPVANASIRATYQQGGSQKTVTATSDAQGNFNLQNIQAQLVDVLVVEAVGYSRNVAMKLPLPLPEPIEIALSPLAGLEIKVLQSLGAGAGQPFSGEAEFVLLQKRGGSTTPTLGIVEANVPQGTFIPFVQRKVTIADGSFRLEELEPGDYKVILHRDQLYGESDVVKVENDRRSATGVTLGAQIPFSGRVVTDADASPVSGAEVKLSLVHKPALGLTIPDAAAETGPEGRFQIAAVPPGSYRAVVSAAGYTTKTVESMILSQQAASEPTSFTLSRQQPKISVQVSDAEGKPIADARLVLLMIRPSQKSIFAKTDESGAYSFGNLQPGNYSLSATYPGERSRQKGMDVTLNEGEGQDVQIVFGNTVRVVGKARKDGKPYKGLVAFVQRGTIGPETMVKTDDNGGYAAELEPGEYVAGAPGQPGAQIVVVRPDTQGQVDIEL